MKFIRNIGATALVVSMTSLLLSVSSIDGTAMAATPLGTDFKPSERLKISRLSAKNRQNIDLDSYIDLDDKRDDAFDENNGDCGNVEIGNIERPRIGQPIGDTEILIVGDIINVPGDC